MTLLRIIVGIVLLIIGLQDLGSFYIEMILCLIGGAFIGWSLGELSA